MKVYGVAIDFRHGYGTEDSHTETSMLGTIFKSKRNAVQAAEEYFYNHISPSDAVVSTFQNGGKLMSYGNRVDMIVTIQEFTLQ